MDLTTAPELSVIVECGTDPVALVGTLVGIVETLGDGAFEVLLLVGDRRPVAEVLDGLGGDVREVVVDGLDGRSAWDVGTAHAAAPRRALLRAGQEVDPVRLRTLMEQPAGTAHAGSSLLPSTPVQTRPRPADAPDVVVSWLQHDYGQLGRPAEAIAHALVDEGLARRVVYVEPPEPGLPPGHLEVRDERGLNVVRTGNAPAATLAATIAEVTGLYRPVLLNCGVTVENWQFLTAWAPLCERTALVTHDTLHLWPGMDSDRSRTLARVRRLLHRASDITLGLSTGSLAGLSGSVYLGHGRDAVWSDPDVDTLPEPLELTDIPHPRVLYFGALSVRINVSAMRVLADSGVHVVIVGFAPDAAVAALIDGHPRVHFLGPRKPDQAPAYLRHVDAGIVPHTPEPFTDSMEPHKLYNYASAGLRSVTTHVTVPDRLRDITVNTSSDASFAAAVHAAVAAGRLDVERTRAARQLDWASVARRALRSVMTCSAMQGVS